MRHLRHKLVARPAGSVCQSEFDKGRVARRKHPLHSGAYKLVETADVLRSCVATLDAIAVDRRQNAKGHGRHFGGCTSDDAHIWLKRLPGVIAYTLGYNALPAIAALGADGVDPRDVKNALTQAQAAAAALVRDCEEVHLSLNAGIAQEYRALRDGYSDLPRLLDRALDIIESARSIVSRRVKDPHLREVNAL
jgi:hypothetical protein